MKKTVFEKYLIDSNGILYNQYNKEMIPQIKSDLKYFKIMINGKRENVFLHKLIIDTFIDGFDDYLDKIDFIDGDKKNCSLDNLKVIKNYYIRREPTKDEITFFENADPYKIIRKYLYSKTDITLNNAFTFDDLLQTYAMYLYEKVPLYFDKFSNIPFDAFAFIIFRSFTKSIYRKIKKYSTFIDLDINLEISGSFASTPEIIRSGSSSYLNRFLELSAR